MPEFAEIGRHLQGGGFWPDMGPAPTRQTSDPSSTDLRGPCIA